MKLADLFLNRYLYKDNSQNSETKGADFKSADSTSEEPSSIPSGGAAQDINTGNVTINGGQLTPGTYPVTILDVSNWGWGQTCAFSSTDLNTVSWGSGVFTSASGESYSISAGNTGNMSAKNYIYLDLLVSETAYQTTTTPANAVGLGKVLIAVANPDTTSATYNLSEATQIVGDNILANSISASKIVTGQLIVGTNVGLGSAQDSAGVTTIIGNTVTTGFVNALSITAGSVAAEDITGTTITGKTFRTASSGQRVIISGADNNIAFYDSDGVYQGEMYGSLTSSGSMFVNAVNGFVISAGGLAFSASSTNNVSYRSLYPSSNSSKDLGGGTLNWRNIYVDGVIGQSDLTLTSSGDDIILNAADDIRLNGDIRVNGTLGVNGDVTFLDGDGVTVWGCSFEGGILIDLTML